MTEIAEEQAAAELPGLIAESVGNRVEKMYGWTREQLSAEAQRCAMILAHGGEQLVLGERPSEKKMTKREMSKPTVVTLTREQGLAGVKARDFTPDEIWDAFATGLAIGALVPGGVTFMGMHFCTMPHPDCPAGNVPPPVPDGEPG